jgi:hypothetical protein
MAANLLFAAGHVGLRRDDPVRHVDAPPGVPVRVDLVRHQCVRRAQPPAAMLALLLGGPVFAACLFDLALER